MIDKITNPAAAANAYATTSKTAEAPGLGAPQKESFTDLLKKHL